jgi:hypothetical protein
MSADNYRSPTTGAGLAHGKRWNILRSDNSVAFSVNREVQDVIDASNSFEDKDYKALDKLLNCSNSTCDDGLKPDVSE